VVEVVPLWRWRFTAADSQQRAKERLRMIAVASLNREPIGVVPIGEPATVKDHLDADPAVARQARRGSSSSPARVNGTRIFSAGGI
jgi:hypothetical protein